MLQQSLCVDILHLMRESSGTPIRHGADATLQNVLRQSPSVRYGNAWAPSIIHLLNSMFPPFESEFLMSASPEDLPWVDRNCLIWIPHSEGAVLCPGDSCLLHLKNHLSVYSVFYRFSCKNHGFPFGAAFSSHSRMEVRW